MFWSIRDSEHWLLATNHSGVQKTVAMLTQLCGLQLHSSSAPMEVQWITVLRSLRELSILGPIDSVWQVDISAMALSRLAYWMTGRVGSCVSTLRSGNSYVALRSLSLPPYRSDRFNSAVVFPAPHLLFPPTCSGMSWSWPVLRL